jgi:integrase
MGKVYVPSGQKNHVLFYTDENGRRRKKTFSESQTDSQKQADYLLEKVRRRRMLREEGLSDPDAERFADAQSKPLAEHIEDWRQYLLDEDKTQKQADMNRDRLRRLVAVIRGARPKEIDGRIMSQAQLKRARSLIKQLIGQAPLSILTADTVQGALARFKNAGWSLQTCNHYRSAPRAFTRWAVLKAKRLRHDPLLGVSGYNVEKDRRHDRRTISVEELRELIGAAERGPVVMDMTGHTRALIYRLAAATGLRYSEIRSIRPESFDWEAPSVTVAAGYTKNGETATLSLPAELLADLKPYTTRCDAGKPVFPLQVSKGATMLRHDLKAAGIPYRDAAGLVFDFHSLRCEMATLADAQGFSLGVTQQRMRHSSSKLTELYIRPRVRDVDAVADSLPSMKPEPPEPQSAVMTGTDPGPVAVDHCNFAATRSSDNDVTLDAVTVKFDRASVDPTDARNTSEPEASAQAHEPS